MKSAIALLSTLLCLAPGFVACRSDRPEDPTMDSDSSSGPGKRGLEANKYFYKENSVMGNITSDGKGVPDATITIVQTGEVVRVEAHGSYSVVLDPEVLGTNTHELVYAAPGLEPVRRTVTVPDDQRVRVDVELRKKR